jgi:putative transposon-encoded protein
MEGSFMLNTPKTRPKRAVKMVNNVTELVEELPSELKVTGFEMIEREVKQSGNTGRVYLPKNWIGSTVKIIRVSKTRGVSRQTKD